MRAHPTAIVDPAARVSPDAEIGPYCVVSAGAEIGPGARLLSHVIVEGRTRIGARTVVHPFASLGAAPQHLGYKGEDTTLVIGDDCIIREGATLNRGTAQGRGETRVGARCFLMAGAHVAHDCVVGDGAIFANSATIGGHVAIGEGVFLGGLCAVHQHSRIGDFAFIGGCAAVTTDVIPYGSAMGNHAALGGLNVIGMKRRGMSRETIHALRGLFSALFKDDGVFAERLVAARAGYSVIPEAQRIFTFIEEGGKRALMGSRRRPWTAGED